MTNGRKASGQESTIFFKILFPAYKMTRSAALDSVDRDGRIKGLTVFRPRIDLPDDLHPLYHFSESGITLTIGVILPAIIETRLVAYADEEFGGRRSRGGPGHGKYAVLVQDMGLLGGLMGDARQGAGLLIVRSPDATLDQLRFGRIGSLIIVVQYPVERAVLIEPRVYIRQKSPHRLWRLPGVQFHFDLPRLRLDQDTRFVRVAGRTSRQQAGKADEHHRGHGISSPSQIVGSHKWI